MILTFSKKVLPDKQVEVYVVGSTDATHQVEIGKLIFPSIQFWTRFIGALNRGALAIPDLTIIVETPRSPTKEPE